MTWREAVRDEAGKLGRTVTDSDVEYILWEHTGFPDFWDIPADGLTPEECMRKQVREFFSPPSDEFMELMRRSGTETL